MNFLKTSISTAFITLIRAVSAFVASKIVAIYTGPAGISIIGTFMNFISIAQAVGNGSINSGVVKYTSQFGNNINKQNRLISTSFLVTLLLSSLVGLFIIFFNVNLSKALNSKFDFSKIIFVFGFSIIFFSLNNLFLSILNGKKNIKLFAIINILGSLFGLLFTIILVFYFKINGAIYSYILSQSIVFFITLYILRNEDWLKFKILFSEFNINIVKKLSHYSLMGLIGIFTLPITQIVIRNMITSRFGINYAGCWQGMTRISDSYLLIVSTALTTYFLPTLSSINNVLGIQKEILKGLKLTMPFVFISCFFIYLFRYNLTSLFFTSDFSPMNDLYLFQLIGDILKVAVWIISYVTLAKSLTKVFVITEILFSITGVLCIHLFTSLYGFRGVSIAFAMNSFFSLIVMTTILKKYLFNDIKMKYGKS